MFFLREQFVLTARIVQRGLAFAQFVFERGDLVQEFLSADIFLFGSLCLLCGLRLLFGLLKQTELLCGILRFAARFGGLGGLLRAQGLQFGALLGKGRSRAAISLSRQSRSLMMASLRVRMDSSNACSRRSRSERLSSRSLSCSR